MLGSIQCAREYSYDICSSLDERVESNFSFKKGKEEGRRKKEGEGEGDRVGMRKGGDMCHYREEWYEIPSCS